jgi:hypothetical protein
MSTQDTLKARQERYGEFVDNAAIAQGIKQVYRNTPGSKYHDLSEDMRESLDMIASKISRILTGNSEYPDNWHDIQGFSKLIENRLLTGSSYKEPAKKK